MWTGRFFSGVITQRSPLRGNITRLEEAYYGSRGDELISGLNTEISPKLTLIRRPGLSVYNSNYLPAVNRFYEFRTLVGNTESIKVLADLAPVSPNTSGTVRDVTGPAPGNGIPPSGNDLLLWNKIGAPAVSGTTSFQSVGNTLYASDLTSSHKWLQSTTSWAESTLFSQDQFIVDSNNNLQLNIGSQTATITNIQIQGNVLTLFFSPSTPLVMPVNASLALSGLTTVPALNGKTIVVTSSVNNFQATAAYTHAPVGYTAETGTITTGTGITNTTAPTWGTTIGAVTADGSAQWANRGSAIQNWGITPPATAPSVTQVIAPTSGYASWAANTWYAPLFVITDSTNLQQLTTAGVTGTTHPTWATTPGATTNDNNGGPATGYAVWTCIGPVAWQTSQAYALGATVQPTFTYYIIVPASGTFHGGAYPATATCLFQCTTAGTSGSVAPTWTNGLSTVVHDGAAVWTNMGLAPAWPGASQTLSLTTQILDTNNNLQTVQTFGKSGATHPVWLTTVGSTTIDNSTSWLDDGSWGSANTGAWLYAYSGENSITGAISTSSPESLPITQLAGNQVVVQGAGLADTQVDTIVLWRTVQGEATLFYLGTIPNPSTTASSASFYVTSNVAYVNSSNSFSAGQSVYLQSFSAGSFLNGQTVTLSAASSGQYSFPFTYADTGSVGSPVTDTAGTATFAGTWTYTDVTPDTSLNILIEAPIDFTNNPPPVGMQALSYHLQRVWGVVGNLVYYSDGPDVISGNGDEAWSPSNVFAYPETVIRLFPTSSGLIVFTLSDTFIIQGLGTSASPLTCLPLPTGVGLSSYDAMDTNGSIIYVYTSDNQLVSLDPSSGVSEIGFPIGDQFGPGNGTNTFTPLSTHVTWHIAGSKDKGLYISDFDGHWWRLSTTPSPETGLTWSPIANFLPTVGGFSAVQSVETSPGTHTLLVGPPPVTGYISGPILMRDYSVHADNTVAYSANAVVGSLVLAQPGQIALVESLTTDSLAVGTPLSLAVQLDEIAPLSSGYFEGLSNYVPDPTELSPSLSVYAQRFYLSQTQQPAVCRHLQVEVNFGTDTVQNELLSMTLFGGFEQEK